MYYSIVEKYERGIEKELFYLMKGIYTYMGNYEYYKRENDNLTKEGFCKFCYKGYNNNIKTLIFTPSIMHLAFMGGGINIEEFLNLLIIRINIADYRLPVERLEDLREYKENMRLQYLNWLKEIIGEFFAEDPQIVKNLLIFWSGTEYINSDKEYLVDINYKDAEDGYIPISHTCFYSIEIYNYSSKEIFKNKLRVSADLGTEGFGFA